MKINNNMTPIEFCKQYDVKLVTTLAAYWRRHNEAIEDGRKAGQLLGKFGKDVPMTDYELSVVSNKYGTKSNTLTVRNNIARAEVSIAPIAKAAPVAAIEQIEVIREVEVNNPTHINTIHELKLQLNELLAEPKEQIFWLQRLFTSNDFATLLILGVLLAQASALFVLLNIFSTKIIGNSPGAVAVVAVLIQLLELMFIVRAKSDGYTENNLNFFCVFNMFVNIAAYTITIYDKELESWYYCLAYTLGICLPLVSRQCAKLYHKTF
jgi:hypothetical protein